MELFPIQTNMPNEKEESQKLAEAEKTIKNWPEKLLESLGGKYPLVRTEKFVEELMAASSLISYEKGREEQRNEVVKDINFGFYKRF